MKCAVCIMVKLGEAFDAVTIIGGTAACVHHMTSISDDNVTSILRRLPVSGGSTQYETDADFEGQE